MNKSNSVKKKNKKSNIIYTLMGNELMTGNKLKIRISRYIYYAKDTVGFSIVYSLIRIMLFGKKSFLIQTDNFFLGLIVDVVLAFIFLYITTFLWYEFRVYRHNAKNSKNFFWSDSTYEEIELSLEKR